MLQKTEGAVVAAKGFRCGGIHCGIRKNREKRDLALIVSEVPCTAAAVYTTNLVKGAPLTVTRAHLEDGRAQAIVCNSGNANTCNANGPEIAEGMCRLVERETGIAASDVVVASTGVIGQPLSLEPMDRGMAALVQSLGKDPAPASEAILTTDTRRKEIAYEFEVGGKICRMGGIAKGSGMIHPNMATMLVFVTTDAAISAAMLKRALLRVVGDTFNMVSVDGDTSTNDMMTVLASGLAGNAEITAEGKDFEAFCEALQAVSSDLCRKIAADGEGATKMLEIEVSGAASPADAKKIAKSVATSTLFKAAMFGADANWGRVLCAIGYAGAKTDVEKIDVRFDSKAGSVEVCRMGAGVDFSEEAAKKVLSEPEIGVRITCRDGDAHAVAWGCDLTYDYVRINGDYRT